jgi:peroxiredoxin Q/BCP
VPKKTDTKTPLAPGDAAPDFTLPADDGTTVSLKKLRGKRVVLYFYPKDNTPGCTAQACEYNDLSRAFAGKNAVVLGVSRDGAKSHQGFRKKYDLDFPLLSDEDHHVQELYGAWGEKNMYGKKMLGTIRTTVVIDERGKIVSYERKVKAAGNAAATLALLA